MEQSEPMNYKKKYGFTLIEIALAMLIFGLAISVLIMLFPSGLTLSRQSNEDTILSAFAEGVLNALALEINGPKGGEFWTNLSWAVKNIEIKGMKPMFGVFDNESSIKIFADNEWHTLEFALAAYEKYSYIRYKLKLEQSALMFGIIIDPAHNVHRYTLIQGPFYSGGKEYWETNSYFPACDAIYWKPVTDYLLKATLETKLGKRGGEITRKFIRYYFDFLSRRA